MDAIDLHPELGSFRDRQNQIAYLGDNVYRFVDQEALANWHALNSTAFFVELCHERKIVQSRLVDPGADHNIFVDDSKWAGALVHERIPVISYPYEWTFGMLKDAASLTLEVLSRALDEKMILKDASAYNIQWQGTIPSFIDVPSLQIYRDGDLWIGYRQFCEMFLLPLMLQGYKDVAFHPWMRGSVDGIPVQEFARLLSMRDLARPGVMKHVYLQSKLQSGYADSDRNLKTEIRSSGFNKNLIRANVDGLSKIVQGIRWNRGRSHWSEYAKTHSYEDEDFRRKQDFIRSSTAQRKWRLVWDLGSNTGAFSKIAAESADYVIAMDSDHLAVERLYQSLKFEECRNILPLVGNIVDPSPSIGWRLSERKTLLDRGKPDLALALALIHHIVIGSNVPMDQFISWLAELGSDLVIEFVTRDDPMVHKLLRNKKDNYSDYTLEWFERCLEARFNVSRREELGSGTRNLYFATPRAKKMNGKIAEV